MPRLVGMRSADMRRAEMPPPTAATRATNRDSTTPRDAKGQTHGSAGRGLSFCVPLGVVATSDSEETAGRSRLTRKERFASGRRPGWLRPREVSHWHISANRSNHRPSRRPVARRPTEESSCRSTFDRAIFQASPDFSARDRHPQPLTAFHATVRMAREKSGFKAGLHQRKKSSWSVDRTLLGTSTIGPYPARPDPAVAPRDSPRSADACRSAIGRPILRGRASRAGRTGCAP
jgi:hypothetical protein